MSIELHRDSLLLKPGPQPDADYRTALWVTPGPLSINLESAPSLLDEWVGREDFLAVLDRDWTDSECRLVGLIGFGGEGKTSIARHWIDRLLNSSTLPQPKGLFWWSFYEQKNVDEFFEAALNYLSREQLDLSTLSSSHAKANFLAGILQTGNYLFILDGVEILQNQNGDEYGLFTNHDLLDFLEYFAASDHESFCILTSRVPLYDLIHYITYIHRDVDRLEDEDGRALLRKLGVTGTDTQLDKAVAQWEGHALTLSLLGTYLVKQQGGEIDRIPQELAPAANENKYERVKRLLRRYDEHLTDEEREFMQVFSAFRLPVKESALQPVFLAPPAIAGRLVNYRILRYNSQEHFYTVHPLIRAHYLDCLERTPNKAREIHERLRRYYSSIAAKTSNWLTLDGVQPLIEMVHHSCQVGDYNTAWRIYWRRITKQNRYILTAALCAYETALVLLRDFFPSGDISQEPLLNSPHDKCQIIEEVAFCLVSLGCLREASRLYTKAKVTAVAVNNWRRAIKAYLRLAEIQFYLGELSTSADTVREASSLANRKGDKWSKMESLVYQALAAYLKGQLTVAGNAFSQAEALQREMRRDGIYPPYLYSWRGLWYVEYLRRTGDLAYAQVVAQENLNICQSKNWFNLVGRSHRIIGDILADRGQHDSARQHYDLALKILRRVYKKDSLIEVLLARGRWAARHGKLKIARSDLSEALTYATSDGYRIYELDINVALAWMHLNESNLSEARAKTEYVRYVSQEIGYYWGQVDAEEVLEAVGSVS